MKVIVNVPCRNGAKEHPLGLHPLWARDGAMWLRSIAMPMLRAGIKAICIMQPAGQPHGVDVTPSQWRALSRRQRAELMLLGEDIRAEGGRFWLYCGSHMDDDPTTPQVEGGKRDGNPMSSKDREEWCDLFETMVDAFDGVILDEVTRVHRDTGSAIYWMERIEAKSRRFGPKLEVGGEAFLRGNKGDSGTAWTKAAWRFDLMHGRVFMAELERWIEKHGFRAQPGEPWYAWLNGHSKTEDADWWGQERARELLERVKAAGFDRVIIDADNARPETVAFVRRFVDAT